MVRLYINVFYVFSFTDIDELALALRRIANNGMEDHLKKYETVLNGCECSGIYLFIHRLF